MRHDERDEGRAGRDAGMATAVDHADDEIPGWSDSAYQEVVDYLDTLSAGQLFMAEDVRRFCAGRLESPPDDRAWGQVMRRVAKDKLIIRSGYSESRNKQAHVRPTTTWIKNPLPT